MGSKAPKAPDYTPIMRAQMHMANVQQQISREQLEWAKETWASDREFMGEIFSITRPILEAEAAFSMSNAESRQRLLDVMARSAEDEAGWARENRQRYQDVFQPIEDQLIADAQSYDSPEKQEELRGRAIGEVSDQFDAARRNAAARLEGYGIDPGQTRSAALDTGIRLQEAASKAAAGEGARLQAEATARALRGEAINIGKGYPGQVAQSYATAMGGAQGGMGAIAGAGMAGAQGMNNLVGARTQQSAAGSGMMGSPTQWMAGASGSMRDAGNTMFNGYNAQLNQWKANQSSMGGIGGAIGSLAGFGMGFFNEGGAIPTDPQDPAGKKDRFAIAVAGDEFVVPASVTRRLGSQYFDKLIAKHGAPDEARAALQRMKTGRPGGGPPPGPQAGAIPLGME